MAKIKQLSKYADVSMKEEYLKQCNDSIRISKSTVAEAKRRLKKMQKAIVLHELKIERLKEKRKEILNLK